MIIEERTHHELNLEAIDRDLRMERSRQAAQTLGWDHFGRSVRRNLLEKRHTLEAKVRLDVLSSLSFMRQNMPIDEEAPATQKVKQLAESLGDSFIVIPSPGGLTIKHSDVVIETGITDEAFTSCKVGYFEQPLFDAPDALTLLKAGQFTDLRDAIQEILSILPKDISSNDKNVCKGALQALESLLIREAADSSFSAINSNRYGFYSPRTELRPGRLYYLAEPMLIRFAEKEGKSHADSEYLDLLPYIEISFVKHNKPCQLPAFNNHGGSEWAEFNEGHVCVCLRFKSGVLFSQETVRKLAKFAPKTPLIRHYVNFYRHLAGRGTLKSNLELTTQFPEADDIQHRYDVNVKALTREDDLVVVEMFLADLRNLTSVIEILRSEWMHSSLWESILAMCESRELPERTAQVADFQLSIRRSKFILQFDTEYGNMTMELTEISPSKYTVETISQITGCSPSEELDKILTEKLNGTWSIPVMLTFAATNLKFNVTSVNLPKSLNCLPNSVNFDKLRNAWLNPSPTTTATTVKEVPVVRKEKKEVATVLESGPVVVPNKLVYTREDDKEFQGALLASFGEVDPYYKRTSTIGKTRAQPKPKRPEPSHLNSMDMMASDIEADRSRQNQINMDPMMRQQEMQRMSHLESARMHMKQSIGAAHAVGLASHQPSPSPGVGGPMRQHSFTMGFEPPAPYDPNIPASIQFPDPAAFGKKQRKPRAKKQPSGEEAPAGRGKGRKGRGAGAVGAVGGRKSTGVPEPNPYGMDPMRPPLQRSFSDYPGHMTPQQMAHYQQMQMQQQFQQSQQFRMQHPMQAPPTSQTPKPLVPAYTEEDSDEECDPPPPPKPLSAQQQSQPPKQFGNPNVNYPGMPLQSPNHLPLTPSPLSAPPKPFSPEQQHFGMKMRENAFWREIESIDVKPNVALLKQQMAAAPENEPSTSNPVPPVLTTEEPKPAPATLTPTKKRTSAFDDIISKIRDKQEKKMQQKVAPPVDSQPDQEAKVEKPPTPQPIMEHPPLLAPHQMDRARQLANVFDDDADDSSAPEVKPVMSALQKALSTDDPSGPSTSSGNYGPPPVLKREVAEDIEAEKEKIVLKIPKKSTSSSADSPRPRKDDRKEGREDRKERDREGDRERDRDKEREDKVAKEKEKKERERERRRQRDRERAEQKRAEKEKDPTAAVQSSSSSSKKRKLDKKDEKDRREPEKKKGKSEVKPTTSMLPTLSLKNFRIPKKDTADDEKKDDVSSAPGPSSSAESSRKDPSGPAPISRKESTSSASTAPTLQRKESFTGLSGPFPPSDHHRSEPPSKKKALPPQSGPPAGGYQGPPIGTSSSRASGSGRSKQPMPPPQQMMRGGPPAEAYRDRASGMRGFPPSSSHYHGSGGAGGSSAKQVASYAQGLPPGMGPPAAKPPHGSNYQASQWVRPPTQQQQQHREPHNYHGMPSLGPPQLQREQPTAPPPQMIPLPREREPPRDPRVHRTDDDGPDSPEEGTLRIDDE